MRNAGSSEYDEGTGTTDQTGAGWETESQGEILSSEPAPCGACDFSLFNRDFSPKQLLFFCCCFELI